MTYITQNTTMRDMLAIAMGKFEGFSYLNKFGKNDDIDTGTVPVDIIDAGGVILFPTDNRIHQIVSSSNQDIGSLVSTGTITSNASNTLIDLTADFIADGVAVGDIILDDTDHDHNVVIAVVSGTELTLETWHHDTEDKTGDTYRVVSPTGTGLAVVHIVSGYKKADGSLYSEFVIMNGTTNVPTTISYYRINRIHGHGAGSNKTNVGPITATADIDSTITAQINIGNGQTQMAVVYVPLGKTAFLTSYYSTIFRDGVASSAMAEIELKSQLWGGDSVNLEHSMGISVEGGLSRVEFNPYKKITQETDLWMRCANVSDNNTVINAGFDIIFVDNDQF